MRLNRTEFPSPCSKDPKHGVVEILRAEAAPEWDAFAYRHPLGTVYHLSSWRRMIEQAFPHIRGRYLVLRDPDDGEIRAGLPVYAVKSWLLGNRMVSVPFASFCDPLVSSAEELSGFLPAVHQLLREQNCRSLSVRSLATRLDMEAYFGCPESVYKHHYLPLDRSPEKLYASFAKSSICQKIQKAVRAGVTIVQVHGPKGMQTCHAILASTRRKVSLPPFPLSFFLTMERMLSSRNLMVFLALQQGEAVGSLDLGIFRQHGTRYPRSQSASVLGDDQGRADGWGDQVQFRPYLRFECGSAGLQAALGDGGRRCGRFSDRAVTAGFFASRARSEKSRGRHRLSRAPVRREAISGAGLRQDWPFLLPPSRVIPAIALLNAGLES
jgi:hypothetical protein